MSSVKKKILLINPAPRDYDTPFIPKMMPLAILAVSSYIVDDYNVILLDRAVKIDDMRFNEILADPDLICVGISCLTGSVIRDSIQCSQKVRESRKDVMVVWGGWHATKVPESILKNNFVDYIVQGEGEVVFFELIRAIGNIKIQRSLPGVGYRDNDGRIIINPTNELLAYDKLPQLPLSLLGSIEPYIIHNWIPGGTRCISWETSRGCPYCCTFCDISYRFGRSYSYRNYSSKF